MKKKKFLAFTLCSLLTLTSIQTPWAFSDEAPDDPAFSDGIIGEVQPHPFFEKGFLS